MASVTIKRGTEAEVASTAITDGQILFTTDREYNNQIMADVGENRILIGGNNIFTGTQAEYEEALSQGLIFEGMQVNITDDYDRDLDADVIVYDNTTSGLASTTVQDAIDEVQSEVVNSYATTDTSDTTIASADKIPFYDESATTKKNITLDNFVDTIAPNFGSQIAVSQGNTLDLLDKDGGLIDSVTIETTANNVSYTDTNNIGETDVQGALDKAIEDVISQSVASGVGYTDTNNIGATNVQSAIDTISKVDTFTSTTYDTTKFGAVIGYKYGNVVTLRVLVNGGLTSNTWFNNSATGLPAKWRPRVTTPLGGVRISTVNDVGKLTYGSLQPDGTITFIETGYNASHDVEVVYIV